MGSLSEAVKSYNQAGIQLLGLRKRSATYKVYDSESGVYTRSVIRACRSPLRDLRGEWGQVEEDAGIRFTTFQRAPMQPCQQVCGTGLEF